GAGTSQHRYRLRDHHQLCRTGRSVRLPQGGARRRHRMRDKSDPDRRAVPPGDPLRWNRRRLPWRPRRQARAARPRAALMATQLPARNRVSPLGEIIAVAGRGAWMGNRGCLHRGRGARDVGRNHQHKTWITCALSFRDRRVPQWEQNRYTPLFFLDEAVALAAGHRPYAECRRKAYNLYRTLWAETHSGAMP